MKNQSNIPTLERQSDKSLLRLRDGMTAGRSASCAINLSSEDGASRKHARFSYKAGRLSITDLGSLNGTFVNGVEIDKTQTLNDGDVIIFDTDNYLVSFALEQSPAATSSSSDTVIANAAERQNPNSIKPEVKVLDDAEFLDSLQAEFKASPAGQSQTSKVTHQPTSNASAISHAYRLAKKWLLPIISFIVLIVVAYQVGFQS